MFRFWGLEFRCASARTRPDSRHRWHPCLSRPGHIYGPVQGSLDHASLNMLEHLKTSLLFCSYPFHLGDMTPASRRLWVPLEMKLHAFLPQIGLWVSPGRAVIQAVCGQLFKLGSCERSISRLKLPKECPTTLSSPYDSDECWPKVLDPRILTCIYIHTRLLLRLFIAPSDSKEKQLVQPNPLHLPAQFLCCFDCCNWLSRETRTVSLHPRRSWTKPRLNHANAYGRARTEHGAIRAG